MNTPQDVPGGLPSTATVRLHRGMDTLDISVEDPSPLFGYAVRLGQFPEQFDSEGRLQGDGVDLAEAFTLRVFVREATELAARQALEEIYAFGRDAEYVQHLGSTRYRALQGSGLSVQEFLPDPYQGRFDTWAGPLTFLPVFARATTIRTSDPTVYAASLADLDASTYHVLTDLSGYVTLTDGSGSVEVTS